MNENEFIPCCTPRGENSVSVCSILGLCRRSIMRLEKKDPTFPKPIRYGYHCFRYRASDVRKWAENHLGMTVNIQEGTVKNVK